MNRRALVACAAVALTAIGGCVMVIAMAGALPAGDPEGATLPFVLSVLAITAFAFGVVGAVVLIRRPENRLGGLLVAAGPLIILTFGGFVAAGIKTVSADWDPARADWAGWVGSVAFYPMFLVFGQIVIRFPDGRLPSLRWRWAVRGLVVAILAVTLLFAVMPGNLGDELGSNPIGLELAPLEALAPFTYALGSIVVIVAMAMGVVAVIVRFRRARGVAREQHKWLLAAIAILAVALPPSFIDGSEGVTAFDVLGFTSLLFVPVSIGIAVTRYRLYEIDRIFSRTLTFTVVVLVLGAMYVLVVVLPFTLVLGRGGGEVPAWMVAGATLGAAALFSPLRRRVQAAVDRRFNRSRYDAELVVERFASQVRDYTDVISISSGLRVAVSGALQPAGVSIWVREVGS